MPQCPICKKNNVNKYCTAADEEYFSSKQEFDFYECSQCEILFIHPLPLDQLAVIYPPNYYSFTEKQKSIAFQMKDWIDGFFYKKILQQVPGTQLKVLDVGGGTGTLLDTIKKADKRVVDTLVVDLDTNAKTIAESRGHQYYCGTIENFENANRYDVILLLNLIEHVANPAKVLHKANSLLSENGVIIIKTPNYRSLDARLFKNSYWGGLHCPRHWVLFSKKSFHLLVEKNNLQVDHFSYTQGAPFWSFSILHWMHRHKWIKASKELPLIYHPLFTVISFCTVIFDFARKPFSTLSQMFFVLSKKKI